MIVVSEGFKPNGYEIKDKCRNAMVSIASEVLVDFPYEISETFSPLHEVDREPKIVMISVPPTPEAFDALDRLLAVIADQEETWGIKLKEYNITLFSTINEYTDEEFSLQPDYPCKCGER